MINFDGDQVQELVTIMTTSVGNFVLEKGTKATMVIPKFPIERVSILFKITGYVGGNVMVERDYVNNHFKAQD